VSTNEVADLGAMVDRLNAFASAGLRAAVSNQVDRIGGLGSLEGQTSQAIREMALGMPLTLSVPRIDALGRLEFTVQGSAASAVRVEYSDDLINWTGLEYVPAGTLPAIVQDDETMTQDARYYRAIDTP